MRTQHHHAYRQNGPSVNSPQLDHPTRDYSLGPRLEDHYTLLRYILRLNPDGLALEFGVGAGDSLKIIAEHMPAIGFDSFQGLPEDWRPGFRRGHFACDPPPHIDNASIIVGLFDDTLPQFTQTLPGYQYIGAPHIGLVHIDCDLYSSTRTVLEHVMPHLNPGCYIIFDEWFGYRGCENHEQRAWQEHIDTHPDTNWTVIGHGIQQWAIQLCE